MERRRLLTLAIGGAASLVAAACGSAAPSSIKKLAARSTTTTAKRAQPTTTTTRPKHKASATSTSTTSSSEPPTTAAAPPTTTAPPATTTTTAAPSWPAIVPATEVAVGGTFDFTFGAGSSHSGEPGIIYQPSVGTFVALDTICTHQGGICAPAAAGILLCPRHGSKFSLADGSVILGPAIYPLSKASVSVDPSNGYVTFRGDIS